MMKISYTELHGEKSTEEHRGKKSLWLSVLQNFKNKLHREKNSVNLCETSVQLCVTEKL